MAENQSSSSDQQATLKSSKEVAGVIPPHNVIPFPPPVPPLASNPGPSSGKATRTLKLRKKAGNENNSNCNYQDSTNRTALHFEIEINKKFEESESLNKSDPLLQIPNDESDIFKAVRYDDLDMLSRLLRQGVNINFVHGGEMCSVRCRSLQQHIMMTRYTPLHMAVLFSEMKTIQFLVNNGADINACDKNNRTPLHYVVNAGRRDVVDYLIKKGVNLNVQSASLKTPLMLAAQRFDSDVLQMLVDAGADLDLQDEKGTSALHIAIFKRPSTQSSITSLIKGGANVDIQNKKMATPLMMAVPARHTSAIEQLLEAGADVNHTDNKKKTPLHFAMELNKSADVSMLLLRKGADINAVDCYGITPLRQAVKFSRMDAIMLLLTADCYRDKEIINCEKIKNLREQYQRFNVFMEKECNEPWTLLRCCRHKIRNHTVPKKLNKLDNLLIPRTLKNYLQFK